MLSGAQRGLLALLTVYKGLFSSLFAGSCRFVPSCSEYARDAIVEHGALKGSWLAARRLARCHPAGSSGFDPVPQRSTRIAR
jgi:putative membrane protein insertion efficiency factor